MRIWLHIGWILLAAHVPLQLKAQTNIFPSPAHEAALKFKRGVNFGNYLEYAPGNPAAVATYIITDFIQAKTEGFDHIRIPVAWHLNVGAGPSFQIASSFFSKVDQMVNNALGRNLAAIINLHHFNEFTSSPQANTAKFYAIWEQIAAHYSNYSGSLAFELLNEPRDAATTAVISPIYSEAIRRIRQTNPNRTIFVGPGNFNSIDEMGGLNLPTQDRNLIVTVHCYDPYYFTHQGAEWALPDTATLGVLYPGPPATPLQPHPAITHDWVISWFRGYNTAPRASNPSSKAAFATRLRIASNYAINRGRPVHVGEFGCYEKAGAGSRVTFHREIRETMDELGLGWAMWDWKAGFHYFRNGRPDPAGLREAIFPPIQLLTSSPGSLELAAAAAGKRFVVERSLSINPPVWQSISTQTLISPPFLYQDPEAESAGAGFYRIQWLK